MPRLVGRLSPKQVQHAKPKDGRPAILLADGGNLYLQATRGADDHVRRSWVFKFEQAGRRREMGLGPFSTIGLAEARQRARELRQMLLDGVDPLDERQKARMAALAERARTVTFRQAAEMYLSLHRDGWRHPKHRQQWENSLARYVYPTLGAMAVADVNSGPVLKIVEPLWSTKTETASRVRGRIELVLDYATASGFRSGDNPARHITASLPKQARVKRVKHHAALPFADVPAFMAELRGRRESVSAHALEFLILSATRTGKSIGAVWSEIDLKARVWVIPAARTKTNREHRVPLSARAVELLTALPRRGRYVFAAGTRDEPLNHTALGGLLKAMRPSTTVHGFRSSFRDWAAESTNYPAIVAEMALSHSVGTSVEKAYRRGDLFAKRRALMNAWARYCAKPVATTGDNVTPIRKAHVDA